MLAALSRGRRFRYAFRILLVIVVIYILLPSPKAPHYSAHDPNSLLSTRAPQIQYAFDASAGGDLYRLQEVKKEFLHAYTGYRTHAWLHDEVKPVSGGSHKQYCGWAATLIDTLDTLYIMGLYDEFDEAVHAVSRLSFAYAPSGFCGVNPFETTIRHLGGLLSAYDISGSRDERLKRKAVEMGNLLFHAFAPNGVQCRSIIWPRFPGWSCEPNAMLSLARLGSQSLEFLRLSMVSGDQKWASKIEFLSKAMERLQDSSHIPGMWPKFFDGTCSEGVCDLDPQNWQWFTMGSGTDSAYEYIVKSHLLYGAKDDIYIKMWQKASPQIKNKLLFQPMNPQNNGMLFPGVIASRGGGSAAFHPEMEHLSCFLGGVFAISSRLLPNDSSDEDLAVATNLTHGCVWGYASTPSGIMPDTFRSLPCLNSLRNCSWDEAAYNKAGGHHYDLTTPLPVGMTEIKRPEYMLRPEAIESVFIMYRVTGDPVWREMGWDMFLAIRNATRTKYGHSSVADVMRKGEETELTDKMESFWLSETLKYFYLLFADPRLVSLDDWVFTTEAHPLRLTDETRGGG